MDPIHDTTLHLNPLEVPQMAMTLGVAGLHVDTNMTFRPLYKALGGYP